MKDDYRKNFGMVIPSGIIKLNQHEPDPNGVPIYRGCPSTGLCACLGICKQIVGYDTDPDKVKAYHEDVERRNKLIKDRMASFNGTTETKGNGIRVWAFEPPNKTEDVDHEVIQPKQLKD